MKSPIIHAVNPKTPNGFYFGIQIIKNGSTNTTDAGFALARMDIWESLSDNTMSASIGMYDTSGFLAAMKIQPGDSIRIVLYNNQPNIQKSIDWTGSILSISDGNRIPSSKGRVFEVDLVDRAAQVNRKQNIARAYNGSPSDIINSVCKEYLDIDKVDAEATEPSMSILGTQRTPFSFIRLMLPSTVSTKHGYGQNFYFYQDPDGFHLKSFKELATTGQIWNYQLSTTPNLQQEGDSNWLRIIGYKHNRQSDQMSNMNGALENELVLFNHMTRTVTNKIYKYKDQYKSTQVLGKFPVVDLKTNIDDWTTPDNDQTIGIRSMVHVYSNVSTPADPNSQPTNQMTAYDQNFGAMTAQAELMNQISYHLKMPGNAELRPGHLISIDANSLSAKSAQEKDKFIQGKYLIGNIHHSMPDVNTFETSVDVFSDGPQQDVTRVST